MITEKKAANDFTPKRVAVYIRTKGVCDTQNIPYQVELNHYEQLRQDNPTWAQVSFYADEGIASHSMKSRGAYNRMISDAMDGMIDLIVTKSFSRFSRNAMETLTTIRKLKDKGVEVHFHQEGFSTLGNYDAEFLATLNAVLEQEEKEVGSQ